MPIVRLSNCGFEDQTWPLDPFLTTSQEVFRPEFDLANPSCFLFYLIDRGNLGWTPCYVPHRAGRRACFDYTYSATQLLCRIPLEVSLRNTDVGVVVSSCSRITERTWLFDESAGVLPGSHTPRTIAKVPCKLKQVSVKLGTSE